MSDLPPSAPSITPLLRVWLAAIGLLGLGILSWWKLYEFSLGTPAQTTALLVALVVAAVPPANRWISAAFERIRRPSLQSLRWATLAVFLIAGCYLLTTATRQHRDFFPKWHDHQSYLLQAHIFASGHLWMPQHELADFFETFHVIVKPVYASMYFPGAALFYVPGVWLHLPNWVMPLAASCALAAMLFRIVAEMVDAVAGGVAVLLLIGLQIFRLLSIWVMSHQIATLLLLCAVFAWMQWRKQHHRGWAIALGVAAGWAAITRPLDALSYCIPLACGVLWDLRGRPTRSRVVNIALIVVAASPFLLLHAIFNKGVTGSWTKFPVTYVEEQETPGLSWYRRPGASIAGAYTTSTLPQKIEFFKSFAMPLARKHAADTMRRAFKRRLGDTLSFTTCSPLLLLLLPVGLLGITDARRAVMVLPFALFLIGYLFYQTLFPHYCMVAAPAIITGAVLAVDVLSRIARRFRSALATGLSLALTALSIGSLPEFNPTVPDDPTRYPLMRFNYEQLPALVKTPAVVLFRFNKASVFHEEPVYNIDAAWPDDCPIIRAHDLGSRNIEILAYYLASQPDRTFYLFDRGDQSLTKLGTAREIEQRFRAGATTNPASGEGIPIMP